MRYGSMKKTARQWKDIYSSLEFEKKYVYEGEGLGALITEQGAFFRLWSPFAEEIILNLYLDGSKGEAFERHAMKRCEKGGMAIPY